MLSKIKNLINKYSFTFYLIVNIVLVTIITFVIGIRYVVSDDFTLNLITSGFFGKEMSQYLIQSNIILGFIVKGLSTLAPSINWYVVIQLILLCLSGTVFSMIVHYHIKNTKVVLTISMFFWLALLAEPIIEITYTTSAGIISLMGLLGIYYSVKNKDNVVNIVCILLCVFGFMYRNKSFLLVIPFGILPLLIDLVICFKNKHNIDYIKRYSIVLMCVVVSIIVVVLMNNKYYQSLDWKEYLSIVPLRSTLMNYDNSFLHNNIKTIGVNWNKSDYQMFINWKFDNPIKYSSQNLKTITSSVDMYYDTNILSLIKKVLYFFFRTTNIISVIVVGLLLLYNLFITRKVINCVLVILITSLIVLLFSYLGRFPYRVSYILWFGFGTLLFIWCSEDINNRFMNSIYVCMLSIILLFSYLFFNRTIRVDNLKSSVFNQLSTKHNSIYVVDVYAIDNEYSYINPVLSVDTSNMGNIVICGDWESPSPLSKNKCMKFGYDNSFDILGNNIGALYVAKTEEDAILMETYLKENYNNNIKRVLIDTLGNGPLIYSFTK